MLDYRFSVEQFEGPLDLLLKLIEDEKLDITTISLAKVADQYLAYLQEQEEVLPAEEIADFLVVAAKLIYIKSKYLLPSLELEEEEGDLEQQLKIYREYYQASKVIHKMIGKKKFSYVRSVPLKLPREQHFSPPQHLTTHALADAFKLVIGKLEVIIRLPKIFLKNTISIREKIQSLKDAIERGIFHFHRLYDKTNKQDIIVSFLALLELVKTRHVAVEQTAMFSEITIRKN
ncbi:MAG: segregation/condensation protein A [Candidatus Komeilibacteria bacterium]|nr:segregation/condensation protein A [Candidatus Komeilibacteria bacterium]